MRCRHRRRPFSLFPTEGRRSEKREEESIHFEEEAPLHTWPSLAEERRDEHTAGDQGGQSSAGKTRISGVLLACSGPTDAKLDLPRVRMEKSRLQLPQGQSAVITNSPLAQVFVFFLHFLKKCSKQKMQTTNFSH